MIQIDGARVLRDLRKLATFGKVGTGVHRIALSVPDVDARKWLRSQMTEAGLEARVDRFGNVYGRAIGIRSSVLIGSHTDSVPNGGWLDGALGVIYGLEIARALSSGDNGKGVDLISFQDEEGTFVPCLGSKSFSGVLKSGEIETATGPGGLRLTDALSQAGFTGEAAKLERPRQVAYLEAHIEQGPKLETSECHIGVVTGIVGIRRFRISAHGRADHAGTTPMEMRKDAGAALICLAAKILEGMPSWAAPDSIWNIGTIEMKPGAANVVPAEASMLLEFRDIDETVLDQIQSRVEAAIATASERSVVKITIERNACIEAVGMDNKLQKLIHEASSRRAGKPLVMPSGAGHDAMVMAKVVPTAMLFIPSIGGRSHDIHENTNDDDIVLGCQVLADTVDAILSDLGSVLR